MHRKLASSVLIVAVLTVLTGSPASGDDDIFGDDEASTPTGDVLQSQGDYAAGLGKGALLRSLSAEQLQEAIDKRLSNRKERVELYYQLRELREEQVEEARMSASRRRKLQQQQVPDRLNDTQIDRATGELYWPKPLDHPVLKPYRQPIEQTLKKRGRSDTIYREFDYLRVSRMISRIEEAIESIQDQLDVREAIALKDYLSQIEYEARFDRNGERVDY